MKPWFPPCQVMKSASPVAEAHRGRWMPGGQILAAGPQDPVPRGPNPAVLWLLFKSPLSQINRSSIRKEKSWAGPVVPSPPPAFADSSLGQPPGLLAQDADPLENPFNPMGFQHSQSSEPGPGRTMCRQDLGAAAACSTPYLLHYLNGVKDNANLEKIWVFLRAEKFWMWPKHVWNRSVSSGFLLG